MTMDKSHLVSTGSHDLVQLSGPLLEGRAPQILDDYMRANLDLIAALSVDAVTDELYVFKNPTGFYESQIAASRRTGTGRTQYDVVVHDSGVIYGPWLAGTGTRNSPDGFRGYAHWRKAAQRIGQLAQQTTVGTLRQLVRKLGD